MNIINIIRIGLFVLLPFFCSTRIYAEIPELIGVIKSDTVNSFFGFRIVPLEDQNNDGYDDFITYSLKNRAYLFYGGSPLDAFVDVVFDSVGHKMNNISDINGDGYSDFSIGGNNPYNWKLNVYYGGPDVDSVRDLWFGLDTLQSQGYTVFCDDINQNGTPEIISFSKWGDITRAVALYDLDPPTDSIPNMIFIPPNQTYIVDYEGFGEGIVSGYFNGDSICDLAVNYRPREQDHKNGEIWFYWGSGEIDSNPDFRIIGPGEFQYTFSGFGTILEYLGDVNGDGYDDVFAGNSQSSDSLSYIYYGGVNMDTIPDVIFTKFCTKARLAGDINNDGYNDLITGYPSYYSNLCRVYLYLGGPAMDSIPDYTFTVNNLGGYHNYIGNDVSGVGDINGDGIDDFAFSAVDVYGKGTIFTYSGWQDPVNVEYNYGSIIPDQYDIGPNYPNPFNSNTTIKVSIPLRGNISLKVYDIMGREIKTIIERDLNAGQYLFRWNGTNNNGIIVSTGIYFLELKSKSYEQSIKMMLLK